MITSYEKLWDELNNCVQTGTLTEDEKINIYTAIVNKWPFISENYNLLRYCLYFYYSFDYHKAEENDKMWINSLEPVKIYINGVDCEYLTEEDNKEMCCCENEFELGNTLLVEDGFDDIGYGKAVIACPGYKLEDVSVQNIDEQVDVVFKYNGEITDQYQFDKAPGYATKVKHNVCDGVFVLAANYDLQTKGSEVDLDLKA